MSADPTALLGRPSPSAQAFTDAYERFLGGVRTAVGSTEKERESAEAYERYMAALGDALAAPAVQARVGHAWSAYLASIVGAFRDERVTGRVEDVFGSYIGELRTAWATLEARDVDAATLLAIAQSAQSAAWLAGMAGRSTAGSSDEAPSTDWTGADWTSGLAGVGDRPESEG